MATLVSVITLVLTGQTLSPANVFVLLAFNNLLRVSLCLDIGNACLGLYDAYVSLGRLEHFLLLENLPSICRDQTTDDRMDIDINYPNSKENSPTDDSEVIQDVSDPGKVNVPIKPFTIIVRNLTYNRVQRKDEFILQDTDFAAKSGSLTVITGPVGSGKSTLLSAIAGEIPDTSGTISCKGTLVYVPQIAWVFSGTVRENILFGEPYDESKYTRIIEACALTEDIHKFPNGDQTVVGERGEVLSGGQRARVSLARAVYADADIFLLDDPLSALDFKVGRHIFEKCIKGLLSHKTRVLTSHQEHHMKEADNVIVLYKGRVLGSGSFSDLKEKGALNTAVDPLYRKLTANELDVICDEEKKENNEVSDRCDETVTQTNEVKGLQMSPEDRTIGVVSSELYWNYFRSGVSLLMVFAVIIWFLISQGMIRQFLFISNFSFIQL